MTDTSITAPADPPISGDDQHLRFLSTTDLAGIDISLADVVATVEGAYRTLHAGQSDNPRKLTVKPPDGHSVSYAMLGRDGSRDVVAIKTSYKHGLDKGRAEQHYYTSLTLYDDRTGLPVALMDCSRIGSLRTPAVSALLARECAAPGARSALVIGTGTQGRLALPFLLTTLPDLDRLMLSGTHPEGIAAVRARLRDHFPDREVELVDDLRAAAADADVLVATAGSHTPAAVEADWLRPGALSVLVGHGLAPSTLHRADRVIATSEAQMHITGLDMADADGKLPAVDAEFPPVLAGSAAGRRSDTEWIFAYNSGLVVTDIALGHRFAQLALAQGLGTEVALWR
ncbi:ornithine cyclodeaminase family protein [Streptomyces sp. Je 1-4]|uniref:ornithine cyclodeaminase family protein n=1 Tax=Streptomyces TaxID=1883 RepID=UPI00140ED6AA|nr:MULTISPECIES: ornithine cyclodeaminase family protein [unclassified Streptomyces]QIK10173.1 ornithine cyclodeaminase family protein [Streptomyces sp. ID38640]UYB43934.1 ornithine cyclodeaminase family protein [Streptomyces sp. Je 1-4]UZQ40356.1 ornithine cyclodeaminase family protein [Streptomyces sp. Je 1-4] [Streptomyces sp. Je 1-4 4N24]UZQ47773.1 ornithine cyclodeaminase family protein [Streptomyces sp. Je 1-4] [Streptomyces sp. Je 1-4 4N24_ara]